MLTKPCLFIITLFSVIVVLSNILSAKMVLLPLVNMAIPAGLLFYPLTFLLSDLVTENYGARVAKFMVYVALSMNLVGFALIEIALMLPGENQQFFQMTLGLSSLRIFSSLAAFTLSQVVDIQLYGFLKKLTQDKHLWLRNNGSVVIAQAVDTVVIDLLYLYGGLHFTLNEIWPVMLFSMSYKVLFSLASTPLFYLLVHLSKKIDPSKAILQTK